jgi:glucose/arabinose dehydrogenase
MTGSSVRGRIALSGVAMAVAAFVSGVHSMDAQAPTYRVVKVVDGLVNPWGMAFLPNGDMLVTERPGRLRIVRGGKLVETPVGGVPAVVARGQGGLLDVALHPQFATNRLVYLSFSKPVDASGAATTAVVRGRFENDQLTNVQEIFVADTKGAPGHFGSRLVFDKQGALFITVGDRQVPPQGNLEAHPAQDFSNHHGTINRVHDDGKPYADNPFVGKAGAKPEIWSKGHRSPQGLALDTETGNLWETEHGPQGGDELNLIRKGANYGWPVIGFGVNYGSGSPIHASSSRAGMEQPKHYWVPSIGTSGLLYYTGSAFPAWKGNLFAGGLVGQQLARFTVRGETAQLAEVLVKDQGRIRDVEQGPDGFIYLAIDGQQAAPTPILRLEPVRR